MPKKIKVLHLIKSLGRGGAEMLLPETLAFHDKDSFEFYCIYFLPWKDQMVESIAANGGKVFCFAANNNVQIVFNARRISQFVKENDIQIIHAHLPWAGILARIVGRMTNVPIIYTEHNKQERYHFATRLMNLVTMNLVDQVVAVSADVEHSIRAHKPGLKASLKTILNGVNVQKFAPQPLTDTTVRERFQIPKEAIVFGTVAVFRFQKRLDLWMQIAEEILRRVPQAHFIIVGDGPLKESLTAKRKVLGMEKKIHMAGLQTDVRPYLQAFNVYMMTSVFEGLPIALLEAMASGCPVISTEAGGIKEVIRHGLDGLLCPVDEPGQLVDYGVQLSEDLHLRESLGAQGRQRVVDSFSMNDMVESLEEVYLRYSQTPA